MKQKKSVVWAVWTPAKSFAAKVGRRFRDDRISVYAAQASFFIALSVVPFIMLLVTLLRYVPVLQEEQIMEMIAQYLPVVVQEPAMGLIEEIFGRTSIPVLSISAITLLWLSARGFKSIGQGIRNVYQTGDRIGYFHNILLSLIFTVGFILFMLVIVLLMVFGRNILDLLQMPENFSRMILGLRWVLFFVILTIVFTLSFRFMTRYDSKVLAHLPGAAFASAGWMAFSALYTLYIDNFADYSYVYGSMAAVVLLALWLYVCMIILMSGAEINMMLFESNAAIRRRRMRNRQERMEAQDDASDVSKNDRNNIF